MGMFEPIAALGEAWVCIINLVCIILCGIVAIVIIVNILRKLLKKSSNVDDSIIVFIVNFVKVGCIIILIAIVLQFLGVPISTLVAVLGAAGAALALALRDSLANVAGGILIVATHPFSKGDIIRVGDDRGIVEHIDLFLTTLKATDYRTITIPNSRVNTHAIYNESDRDTRRIDCEFTISYETDIEKAKAILLDVCKKGELIIDDPEPWIGVSKHGENGLILECLAYCRQDDQWHARYYLNEKVKDAFAAEGVEIPYQHVDVSLSTAEH